MKYLSSTLLIICITVGANTGCQPEQEQKPTAKVTLDLSKLPAGTLNFTAPDAWTKEQPSSRMRRAQFSLPGDAGPAELTVYHFRNQGGTIEQNLQRWYQQFHQPDGGETASTAETSEIQVGPLPVTVTHFTGTYLKTRSPMMTGPVDSLQNHAMLGAIVPSANGPWFIKTTGPENTIAAHKDAFLQFVQTFQIQ